MSRRGRIAALAVLVAAVGLPVLVTSCGWLTHDADPSRCPEGLRPLGARCCGEGQRLEADACVGAPLRCSAGLEPSTIGCAARERGEVLVTGGAFTFGSSDWEKTEPQRAVEVATFRIDRFEVTRAEFTACTAARACVALPEGEPLTPVVDVSFDEAVAYCSFRGGRLPTAEEWVYAAVGTEGRKYPWGMTGVVCRRAAFGLERGPCAEGGIGPDIVGSRPEGATPSGIHDLAGNVAEWTSPRADGIVEARGGSFTTAAGYALKSYVTRELARDTRHRDVGFRCVYPESPESAGVH